MKKLLPLLSKSEYQLPNKSWLEKLLLLKFLIIKIRKAKNNIFIKF